MDADVPPSPGDSKELPGGGGAAATTATATAAASALPSLPSLLRALDDAACCATFSTRRWSWSADTPVSLKAV